MKCFNHLEIDAVGTCSSCNKALCRECSLDMNGKLICRDCLAVGKVRNSEYDENTAFLIELLAGLFGFLGIGYIYVGRTNEGVTRLILFFIYNVIAWFVISLLFAILIGFCLVPIQLIIQIGVVIWSANTLKKDLLQ